MKKNTVLLLLAAILLVLPVFSNCSNKLTVTDDIPRIQDDYITYTDEIVQFSISYPPDWETEFSSMASKWKTREEWLDSNLKEESVEQGQIVFFAGLPVQGAHKPNVCVIYGNLSSDISTNEQLVEEQSSLLKKLFNTGYTEISRSNIIVDGKEAIIVHCEVAKTDYGPGYYLLMYMVVDNVGWNVTCSAFSSSQYDEWESDFNNIINSFRLLK